MTVAMDPDDIELEFSTVGLSPDESVVDQECNDRWWSYASEKPLGDGVGYFAYDLETVPDEKWFPRPSVTDNPSAAVEDMSGSDLLEVLATEKTTRSFLSGSPDDFHVKQLLNAEQSSDKPRKGVLGAITEYLGKSEKELSDWKRLAVEPHACRIVAMGIRDYFDTNVRVWIARDEDEERTIISDFFDLIAADRIRVGYNIASFDDRVIMWRAIKLGIEPPSQIHCARYGGKNSVDIALTLFSSKMMKLKELLPMVGINPPAGDTDGSMVLEMVDSGEWDELARYVASDAWSEMELFQKIQKVISV